MGRPKNSKNKVKKVEKEIEEVIDEAVDEVADEVIDEVFKEKSGNPLMGYTMDEIRGFVNEVNPVCASGGCLHLKEFHIKNLAGKLECHLCNCKDFQV